MEAPTGPLAGTNEALFSMVLTRAGHGWEIVSFHNTLRPRETAAHRWHVPASVVDPTRLQDFAPERSGGFLDVVNRA